MVAKWMARAFLCYCSAALVGNLLWLRVCWGLPVLCPSSWWSVLTWLTKHARWRDHSWGERTVKKVCTCNGGHCALSGTPSCFYGHFSHRSCWRSTIKQRALAGPSKDTAIKWKVPTLQVTLSFDTSHSAGNYFISSFPFLNMILFSTVAPLVLKSIPVLWQSAAFLTNWSGLLALSSWPISFPRCHSSSTLFAFQWPLCLPLYCLILCPPCMNSNSMSASAVLLWNSPRKRWNMK